MRRYSTSSIESRVCSAMVLSGMVRSSDGRLNAKRFINSAGSKYALLYRDIKCIISYN